jgi:hypothetical protein
VLTPLLATMVLLTQAPAAPDGPITVLIAPPDTAGVPGHVVEFSQEHVAEQARSKGLTVIRMKDVLRKLPAAKRRSLLKCKRTELKCLTALGEAARSEVVLVAELYQRLDGYRVGTKVYKTQEGALVAERLIPGVREDGMLDALTQSLDVVVPQMLRELRPGSAPPITENPPPDNTNPQVVENTPDPNQPDVKQPDVKQPDVKQPDVKQPDVKQPDIIAEVPTPATRRYAWVPAAGGAVALGAGTYFLLQAKDRYEQLQGGEPGAGIDGARLEREGRRNQNLSRVAFGVGAAGVVTGVVLFLLPGEQAPVKPSVAIGPGGGMVGVVGTLP